MSNPDPGQKPSLQHGETLIFLGDHTSPDNPGYIEIIRTVTERFYPDLHLRLISAGAKGQSAAGLRSQALLEIITSSHPDYLVIGVGLTDALREPAASTVLENYRARMAERDQAIESTFGPEYQPHIEEREPVSDSGPAPGLELHRIEAFEDNLRAVIEALRAHGVRTVLMTTVLLANDPHYPLNIFLRAYSKTMREIAGSEGMPLVDVEKAFRDILDRAANYKQKAVLMGPDGALNAQGETLIARTFLDTFGLLPSPGFKRQI